MAEEGNTYVNISTSAESEWVSTHYAMYSSVHNNGNGMSKTPGLPIYKKDKLTLLFWGKIGWIYFTDDPIPVAWWWWIYKIEVSFGLELLFGVFFWPLLEKQKKISQSNRKILILLSIIIKWKFLQTNFTTSWPLGLLLGTRE